MGPVCSVGMFHIVRKFEDLRAAFAAEAGDGAAAPDGGGGADDAHSSHRVFEVCATSTLCCAVLQRVGLP